ncbi:MAG: zinc ABC transporter substrate-binding protein [Clostridia bacterium]
MRKIVIIFIALILALPLLAACEDTNDTDSLKVVTSFYVMDDFAKKIGGDKASYICLVPPGGDAHHWEPSTKDMVSLEKSDIFIYNGAGFEHWTEDVLDSLSNKNLIKIATAKDVSLIERSGGSHGGHDPHTWLSPLNAKIQLKSIRDTFILADPANKDYYQANYEVYAAKCDKLHDDFLLGLDSYEERAIVVSHRAFGYLAEEYDLEQISIAGLSTEEEPSAARMAEIADIVNERGIKVVFFEELVSPAIANAIANETGAETAVLSPVEGLTAAQTAEGADYFSVMQDNLVAIIDALGKLNG